MSNELKIDVPDIIKKKLRAIDSFARMQQAMPDPIYREAADAIEQLQRELDDARKDCATIKGALMRVCVEADEFRAEWRINHPRNTPISESACITNAKLVLDRIETAKQP